MKDVSGFKRSLIDTIRASGFLGDKSVPDEFWDSNCTELDLSNAQLSSAKVVMVVRKCKDKLCKLRLSNCFRVDDACVRQVLHSCPNLTTLCLEGCRKITDATVMMLCTMGLHLEHIDLSGCFNLTGKGIQTLICEHPNRRRWKGLHISGLPVFDNLLSKLPEVCPDLESLSVGYLRCKDEILRDIICNHLTSLRSLRLHFSENVTNVSILQIASACPDLTYVDLKGCILITSSTVAALSAYNITVLR
jgi:hypothetical protein